MRKEFEESQKSNPMASLMSGGGGSAAPNPMANFDMASYLSGAPSKDSSTTVNENNNEAASGSGKKKGGRR